MKQYIPVAGNSSLARDPNTGAIVNINTQEINDARARKAARNKEKQEIQQLKTDVAEIKQMLAKLVERL
jgi:hypothetical protein